jgi:hypothetical protein
MLMMHTQPPRDSPPSFGATIGKDGSAQFISTMLTVLTQNAALRVG